MNYLQSTDNNFSPVSLWLKCQLPKHRGLCPPCLLSSQERGGCYEFCVCYNLAFWKKELTTYDCSHEIKRCSLLGRKVMTNSDSILKSRDITLPTKVYLVKSIVFPVVMYGCESWTIKKAEHRRIDAFELWCWRRLLKVPRTARIQPVMTS